MGNLTAHMKSLDLWENTIMIAASDNGTFVVRKNTMVVCVSHSSVVKRENGSIFTDSLETHGSTIYQVVLRCHLYIETIIFAKTGSGQS